MKALNIMIKPASGLCNLRCRYCFYADVTNLREVQSYGIMTEDCMDRILQNIRAEVTPGDTLHISFQGGEPLMAGLPLIRHFFEQMETFQGIRVSYALQTNATLLNDDWCELLKKHDVLLGVSWDLLTECHDKTRVDASGKGTEKQVLQGIALLEKWKIEYNILCTLTSFVAKHPEQVFRTLKRHHIQYVQFTPCLGPFDAVKEDPYALTPNRFYSFYDTLFRLWYEDLKKDRYLSVKFFDDVVNLLLYGQPTACGMNGICAPQLVLEADGSAYPCDFYCMDEWKLGNLAEAPLSEILKAEKRIAFRDRPHTEPTLCRSCEFYRFCHGNCKRMQKEICLKPEDTFCGYRAFLSDHMREFQLIARSQRELMR